MKAVIVVPLALLLVALLGNSASAKHSGKPILGQWKPIKNVNDPHIKKVVDFAVNLYNKRPNAHVRHAKVVFGETQLDSGTYYRMLLEADGKTNYMVMVKERDWANSMTLIAFKRILKH